MTTRPEPGESLLMARRRLERGLEASASTAQQPQRGTYLVRQSREYFTLAEGALYVRFDATAKDTVRAFRRWLDRHAVPVLRRGRTLLVERSVLDAALRS